MSDNQKKPVIHAIASDWGNVVVRFDDRRTAAALAPHSSSLDEEGIHETLFVKGRALLDRYLAGKVASRDFRTEARRLLGLTCTDATFDRAFTDVFVPNGRLIDVWRGMKRRGVGLVAASNVEVLRHRKLIELHIHGLFDRHCLSYQVGAIKPEERYFGRLIAICDVPPENILFVDDRADLVIAAQAFGLHAVAYDQDDHDAFLHQLERYAFHPPA